MELQFSGVPPPPPKEDASNTDRRFLPANAASADATSLNARLLSYKGAVGAEDSMLVLQRWFRKKRQYLNDIKIAKKRSIEDSKAKSQSRNGRDDMERALLQKNEERLLIG